VWIGNYKLDVLRAGKITSIEPRNRLPGRRMTSLLEDRGGRLWVGIDQDLYVYEGGNFRRIPTRDGSLLGGVRAMAEDIDGSIWVTTTGRNETNHRLFRIRDFNVLDEISSPQLPPGNTLAADPHGGVWIGLASGGVARFRNGRMESFPFSGTQYGPVYGLLANSDASVLAATPSGLRRMAFPVTSFTASSPTGKLLFGFTRHAELLPSPMRSCSDGGNRPARR
jgi:hypothetical protein